tara:strand:- start:453 stop:701 length:249 start_codon:yes stop_codon:yes gene_type:complete
VEFRNKRSYEIDGVHVELAPPDYVIVRKLEYFREGGSEKRLRDIRSILKTSANVTDSEAMQSWIGRLNLEDQWRQADHERGA